ncbi:uncharacterized protein LOC127002022 [Eriocheir sinensis]|uniref:uncharacterized protein LOC127002022 n=1 Tax=Eriocheir sinensis TaxID=95602 RepID=UPI0021CAC903|nr:uncharacterized protein LOC127002022 [Eriocheir sinensis]
MRGGFPRDVRGPGCNIKAGAALEVSTTRLSEFVFAVLRQTPPRSSPFKMSSTSWCGRVGLVTAGGLLLLLLLAAHAQAGPVVKRDVDSLFDGKMKRPFCNAFTGCGKKRSDPELDGLASGSELNGLAKHVLAEAKLWEQLQNKMEALRLLNSRLDSRPMLRRKRSLSQPEHANPDAALDDKASVWLGGCYTTEVAVQW